MKKLSIADVKASEILSKDERKMVVGGSGTCGLNCWKDGDRVKAIRGMSRNEAQSQQIEWRNDADGRALYDMCYWCCESC